MEKKWYCAPFIKGVLVVLAHIAVVASLIGIYLGDSLVPE